MVKTPSGCSTSSRTPRPASACVCSKPFHANTQRTLSCQRGISHRYRCRFDRHSAPSPAEQRRISWPEAASVLHRPPGRPCQGLHLALSTTHVAHTLKKNRGGWRQKQRRRRGHIRKTKHEGTAPYQKHGKGVLAATPLISDAHKIALSLSLSSVELLSQAPCRAGCAAFLCASFHFWCASLLRIRPPRSNSKGFVPTLSFLTEQSFHTAVPGPRFLPSFFVQGDRTARGHAFTYLRSITPFLKFVASRAPFFLTTPHLFVFHLFFYHHALEDDPARGGSHSSSSLPVLWW